MSSLFTGQYIGGENSGTGTDDGLIIFQLPQGLQSNKVTQLNDLIPVMNQGFADRCAAGQSEYCGCQLDVDTNLLYNIADCNSFRNVLSYAVNKYNNFIVSCPLYNDETNGNTISYQEVTVNGKLVSMITFTSEWATETHTLSGYCSDATNRVIVTEGYPISNYMNQFPTEPSTLNGYVPYLMANFGEVEGNTGADVCKDNTDCLTTQECQSNFCVAKSTACDTTTCTDWSTCTNGTQTRTCTDTDCTGSNISKSCSTTTTSDKEWYEGPMIWVIAVIFMMFAFMMRKN